MQDFSSVNIKNMIIHNVGNKVKGESLEISTEICDANNEVTNQYLKQFFFSTFKFDVTYRFVHETDIAMNEIYNYVKHIFENPSEFYEQSVNIAKHLYEVSVHPNIKAGELYIVYLQNCIIDDNVTDAIGIYKSESKDYYLQVNSNSPNGFLEFEAVKNIEIGPDRESKQPLPDSAKWMNGSVKNIIINSEKGETLENVEYISDPSYHDVLILRQVQAQYRFEFGEMNGFCIIEYGFPHYFRKYVKGDAFESRLANIYFGKTSKSQNVKNATRLILEEFEKLYQTQYHLCLKR